MFGTAFGINYTIHNTGTLHVTSGAIVVGQASTLLDILHVREHSMQRGRVIGTEKALQRVGGVCGSRNMTSVVMGYPNPEQKPPVAKPASVQALETSRMLFWSTSALRADDFRWAPGSDSISRVPVPGFMDIPTTRTNSSPFRMPFVTRTASYTSTLVI